MTHKNLSLIPNHKSDFTAIDNLRRASKQEVISVAGELFEWIQDGNWPVAKDVMEILASYTNHVKTQIVHVLTSNDDTWKYWCICGVIDKTRDKHLDQEILDELRRISEHPTTGETVEGVAEVASETLTDWLNKGNV